jgi:D-Tyr-tRNAtyr deacylase
MRLIIQRCKNIVVRSVADNSTVTSSSEAGLLVQLAHHASDTTREIDWAARKVLSLRLWSKRAAGGSWDVSVVKRELHVVVVAQPLAAVVVDDGAAVSPAASELAPDDPLVAARFAEFVETLRYVYAVDKVHTVGGHDGDAAAAVNGQVFGSDATVAFVNDGPITIPLTTLGKALPKPKGRPPVKTKKPAKAAAPTEVE